MVNSIKRCTSVSPVTFTEELFGDVYVNLDGSKPMVGVLTAPNVLASDPQNMSINALTRKDYVDGRDTTLTTDYTARDTTVITAVTTAYQAADAAVTTAYQNADTFKVDKAGDQMTGSLGITTATHDALRLRKAIANEWKYVSFQNEAGTRRCLVGCSPISHDMYLWADSANMVFYTNATEKARIDQNGALLIGKTGWGTQHIAGTEINWYGGLSTTWAVNGSSIGMSHIDNGVGGGYGTGADVDGSWYQSYSRYTTTIGTVTQFGNAGVRFNQSSHAPWKGNVTDLDDDEAIERVEQWRPVAFQWKLDDDGMPSEDGTPQGEVEHGFIAQEMNEINPSAVTPGYGTEAEHRTWVAETAAAKEADPSYVPPPDPFMPWMADWKCLVPDLAAAVQALIRRNTRLEERVAVLEGS